MAKPIINPVKVGSCMLRMMEQTDIEQVRVWRNRDDIRHRFVHSDIISPDDQRRWWKSYVDRDDDLFFIIEDIDEKAGPVGTAALYDIDMDAGRAEFGRLMIGVAAARDRDLAKSALRAILTIAFDDLHLDEVYLKVYPDNTPAISVYHACGFKSTGIQDGMVYMFLCR